MNLGIFSLRKHIKMLQLPQNHFCSKLIDNIEKIMVRKYTKFLFYQSSKEEETNYDQFIQL